MKATLDDKGTLTVSAENDVEAFALRHWNLDSYVLCIDTRSYIKEISVREVRDDG